MKVMCECGHPQVLHMGPTGPCRVEDLSDILIVFPPPAKQPPRCPCAGFVLADRFKQRADLG